MMFDVSDDAELNFGLIWLGDILAQLEHSGVVQVHGTRSVSGGGVATVFCDGAMTTVRAIEEGERIVVEVGDSVAGEFLPEQAGYAKAVIRAKLLVG